jgi:hypothetical protein
LVEMTIMLVEMTVMLVWKPPWELETRHVACVARGFRNSGILLKNGIEPRYIELITLDLFYFFCINKVITKSSGLDSVPVLG